MGLFFEGSLYLCIPLLILAMIANYSYRKFWWQPIAATTIFLLAITPWSAPTSGEIVGWLLILTMFTGLFGIPIALLLILLPAWISRLFRTQSRGNAEK